MGGMDERRHKRLGAALIGIGLATILGGVLYVLEAANGPGRGPTTFAQRRSYDQVKSAVHQSFPIGAAVALAGLGLAWAGSRLRSSASPSG